MDMDKQTYRRYADARAPRSSSPRNCLRAFWVGGTICLVGQSLCDLYTGICSMSREDGGTLASITLVLISAVLTGLGVFDRIAKYAGAGTLVPITGFANAVASPAIDARSEGLILGVGAKIFTVAGPVLLYGTLAGAFCGVIFWIIGLCTA